MTTVIVLLVIILTMVMFHLKCSLMSSISTLWFLIFSTIVAFSYYEVPANLFLSRGLGIQYAHAGSYVLLLILGFALLRVAGDFLIGSNIELGVPIKTTVTIVCGFLSGFIIAGNLLIVIGMLPVQQKLLYSRFDPDKTVQVNSPKKALLNPDGFVTGLYNMVSGGSMRSGKSFAVLHPNFVSQNHLNRLKVKEGVVAVCAKESLEVPGGKEVHPLRRWKTMDHDVVLVRMNISDKDIASGGAKLNMEKVTFFPAQIQLTYSKDGDSSERPFLGRTETTYPVGFLENGRLKEYGLTEIVTPSKDALVKRMFQIDAAFELPQGAKPILLQFKQCSVVDLTPYKIVDRTDETERALDGEEQQ